MGEERPRQAGAPGGRLRATGPEKATGVASGHLKCTVSEETIKVYRDIITHGHDCKNTVFKSLNKKGIHISYKNVATKSKAFL